MQMAGKSPVKAPLKLTLLKDVQGLGSLGDVVRVSPGYARNFLLPRKLATKPGGDAEKRVGAIRKRAAAQQAKDLEQAKAAASALSNVSVHVEVKAGEGGHLYGSVTPTMISDALKAQGFEVPAESVALDNPIKELGIYDVPLKLHGGVESKVKLYVVAPAPEKPEKPEKGAGKAAAEKKSDKKK
jgi:large subunit ribosomal protein L9